MAQTKRKSKRSVSNQVADGLTKALDTAAILREQYEHNLADRIELSIDTIMDGMKKRGLGCSCNLLKQHSRRYSCACRVLTAAEQKKAPSLGQSARVNCRDGQGRFVPVAQCKGPVGRDPKTGKYVSIK